MTSNTHKKQIVFLYTELAEYFLACIKKFIEQYDCNVHIVRWPINKEAPFDFKFPSGVKVYDKSEYTVSKLQQLINKINPSVIYCSGWIDKDYLTICKSYKKQIPVVVGIDNKWKGTIKQYLASIVSPFKVLKYFSHAWVSGSSQQEFAKRLGFKNEQIFTGFYSSDVDLFYGKYLANKETKQNNFPKRFLYVGRYYEFKGIKDLWQAFMDLQKEQPNEWELWCLGVGDIEPIIHPKIKHFGFVQPKDMDRFVKETGVFILPSHVEPWGVVVHEYAAAGFPLICSDEVGAATVFLEDDKNGYSYASGNTEELKNVLKKIIDKTDEELLQMSEKSIEKSKNITPQKWANTLMSILKSSPTIQHSTLKTQHS